VNLGHESVVAFSFGERFAIELNCFARAFRHFCRACQAHQDGSSRRSLRRRLIRLPEQGDRAPVVACLAVPVGAIENASSHVVDICGRCEPKCQLAQLGGGSG
jgi:hypothetical protein